jgi:hypothetical protein
MPRRRGIKLDNRQKAPSIDYHRSPETRSGGVWVNPTKKAKIEGEPLLLIVSGRALGTALDIINIMS